MHGKIRYNMQHCIPVHPLYKNNGSTVTGLYLINIVFKEEYVYATY